MRKFISIIVVSFILLLTFFIVERMRFYDGKFHVVFCDVGQGDAVFVSTPDRYDILIDGGPDDSIIRCLESHMPFWDRTIDIVFMSHFNADHYNGIIDLVGSYQVETFMTGCMIADESFRSFAENLKTHGVAVKKSQKGSLLRTSDGVMISVLWPDETFCKGTYDDLNDTSLIQTVTYENFDILLTGDIPFDILNKTLSSLKTDPEILKLSHHGSKTGLDRKTFEIISPKLSIISSGRDNQYGHPHKQVTDLLANKKLKYLRTDEKGDIEIVSDGEKFWVK